MKIIVIITGVLLVASSVCNAQDVSTASVEAPTKDNYDSSLNFNQLGCNIDSRSLVGQEIYFARRNDYNYRNTITTADTLYKGITSNKEVPNPAYVPLVIKPKPNYAARYQQQPTPGGVIGLFKQKKQQAEDHAGSVDKRYEQEHSNTNVYAPVKLEDNVPATPYSALENKSFKIIDCNLFSEGSGGSNCSIHITVQGEGEDTIEIPVYAHKNYTDYNNLPCRSIYLKGYIEYLRNNYLNKKLYVKREHWIPQSYYNITNKQSYPITKEGLWTCTDVNFMFVENDLFGRLYLICKNNKGHEILVAPGVINNNEKDLPLKAFWTEKEYTIYKSTEDSIAKTRKTEDLRHKDEIISKEELIKKYGKVYGTAIANGKVKVGMTKRMCVLAWGNPFTTSTAMYNHRVVDIWYYEIARSLTFSDEKLVLIIE